MSLKMIGLSVGVKEANFDEMATSSLDVAATLHFQASPKFLVLLICVSAQMTNDPNFDLPTA